MKKSLVLFFLVLVLAFVLAGTEVYEDLSWKGPLGIGCIPFGLCDNEAELLGPEERGDQFWFPIPKGVSKFLVPEDPGPWLLCSRGICLFGAWGRRGLMDAAME